MDLGGRGVLMADPINLRAALQNRGGAYVRPGSSATAPGLGVKQDSPPRADALATNLKAGISWFASFLNETVTAANDSLKGVKEEPGASLNSLSLGARWRRDNKSSGDIGPLRRKSTQAGSASMSAANPLRARLQVRGGVTDIPSRNADLVSLTSGAPEPEPFADSMEYEAQEQARDRETEELRRQLDEMRAKLASMEAAAKASITDPAGVPLETPLAASPIEAGAPVVAPSELSMASSPPSVAAASSAEVASADATTSEISAKPPIADETSAVASESAEASCLETAEVAEVAVAVPVEASCRVTAEVVEAAISPAGVEASEVETRSAAEIAQAATTSAAADPSTADTRSPAEIAQARIMELEEELRKLRQAASDAQSARPRHRFSMPAQWQKQSPGEAELRGVLAAAHSRAEGAADESEDEEDDTVGDLPETQRGGRHEPRRCNSWAPTSSQSPGSLPRDEATLSSFQASKDFWGKKAIGFASASLAGEKRMSQVEAQAKLLRLTSSTSSDLNEVRRIRRILETYQLEAGEAR